LLQKSKTLKDTSALYEAGRVPVSRFEQYCRDVSFVSTLYEAGKLPVKQFE
jgi:hypothetical protein